MDEWVGSGEAMNQFFGLCLGQVLVCVEGISLVGSVDGVDVCGDQNVGCLGFCGMGIKRVVMDG